MRSTRYFCAVIAFALLGCGMRQPQTMRPENAVSEGFVSAEPGVQLYYRVIGTGSDTVLVPAAAWWVSHVAPLAHSHTLILYDPRARGRSSHVAPEKIGMRHEIDDLESVRRHFRLTRMSLVGWSYLGAMVTLYAIQHPERVNRIVMVGPLSPRREPYWAQYLGDLAARADTAANRRVAQLQRAGRDTADPVAFCAERYRAMQAAAVSDRSAIGRILSAGMCGLPNEWPRNLLLAPLVASWGTWDWRDSARTLQVPVLVVHWAGDNIPLEGSREWAASLRNARVVVTPGAGHYPQAEQPDAFCKAVARFLSGDWPNDAERPRQSSLKAAPITDASSRWPPNVR